jgi:hypothetical protein
MKRHLLFFAITLSLFSCRKESTNPEVLPNAYSNQALGASANDMLSDSKYTSLQIQVQYMPGYALDTATLTNLTAYLNTVCNKPGGITITQSQIAASQGDTVTVDKAAVIEAQNRSAYTSGSTIAVYILVTDGYDTSTSILGFAYRSTSICLFGRDISDHSGGVGEVTKVSLESGVLEHEFGHIMGLVNLGTPMVVFHQDTAHGNHCNNPKCLMYYAMDTHVAFGTMSNSIPVLDSNCRNDLHANGGK